MAGQKKSVEIECPRCKIRFRLWVPLYIFSQWKDGKEIGCVKCRANIKLKKENDSFRVSAEQPLKETILEAKPERAASEVLGTGATILVVDDDAVIRKMAENVLIKNKFTPLTARSGPEALNILEKKQAAAIVVDLHLKNSKDPQSDMDGEKFLQRVVDSGRKIPAVVTTGKYLIDDTILEPKWYNLHVMAFIQKGSPFWTDELITKIKEILKKD
ncbi:MAG: response regulator [Deltaproteobacteria bacterium]|nr:response regulator [Deltaproteobacteria bacterium]